MTFNGTVLIVDDAADARKILERMLRSRGIDVVQASNGTEALALLSTGRFDLVLMDVQMPEFDGHSVTRLLREIGNSVPVIALSANAEASDIIRSAEAGCNEHIGKPFKPSDLDDLLNRFLKVSQSNLPTEEFDSLSAASSFVGALPEKTVRLRELLAVGDWGAITELAHQICGTAGLCGLMEYHQILCQLQLASEAGESDACRKIIDNLANMTATKS